MSAGRPTELFIDIGGCETLAFAFNSYASYAKNAPDGRPAWSYEQSVLSRIFSAQVLKTDDEHLKRWRNQRLFWSSAYCKTQFAASLAEHRWVSELIRSVVSVADYAHVFDEGDYYHTLDIEDAAKAIHANGMLINSIMAKMAGDGVHIVKGGETKIKPSRKQSSEITK